MTTPASFRNRTIFRRHALLSIGAGLMIFFRAPLAAAENAANSALPVAYAAHVERAGRETRLVFSLTACAPAQAYVLGAPARAIVDLAEVNFQIDPPARERAPAAKPAAEASLIASYRFGRLSAGKSRVVVDLSAPAEVLSVGCVFPDKAGGGELTLSLAPQAEAAFKAAARAGAQRQAEAVAAEEQSQTQVSAAQPAGPTAESRPLVMLDPGHGGIDTGARGRDNAIEKNVVLDFAKVLAARLRESGRYRVVLTREDDTFVSLDERVRLARKAGAALFLSLHADALAGDGAGVQGATVYTVSDRASDAEAARIAQHENDADSSAGIEAREEVGDVNDILFDLTRRETRAFSHVFAQSLMEDWKVAARLNKNPRRSAGFVVLKAPDVPSVLLELGYLSNKADVSDLTSLQWREKTAAQAAHAIDSFFAPRTAPAANPHP